MHRRVLAALGTGIALSILGSGVVSAQPLPGTGSSEGAPAPFSQTSPAKSARIDKVEMLTDRRAAVFVDSPSMGKIVQVQVLLPAAQAVSRPTLYVLDGVSAGKESNYAESTWTQKTDIVDFFANKNANVVLPVGGSSSYYTDWNVPDPILGVNMWETFLTQELPPLIDARFSGNGTNAIAGVSMGAQAAMDLITRHPDLYTGVAGLSGCYDNSQNNLKDAVRATVAMNGGNATNMWGENADLRWVEHDPSRNAEALRGKDVYISVGTGLPGPYELGPGGSGLEVAAQGGPLEAAALYCTTLFDTRLRSLDIDATVVYRPYGIHQWVYWQDDLRESWPTLERALGL
ncbi:esterase family protein [Rhodococcus sp. RS1C4]|uniref:alpha/beta hydrolase n=1 Tax=Nocardiaceae TaxID=85025 RepID=UPI00035D17EE|nr:MULTISPECIES: alpha/beta hydrolase family protein [Rhodococcus]OZC49257.1 esterase family protein [Rhodococcus sp. 06-621-2]OZC53348.1 esterase family protein [Rhodococcus sp. RS1C4]OZE83199.1 esterase family protein [Rhodococcus sp. 15-649-1-2]OZF07123.1 esterase family protein [Rhodococcus sp. 15-1154-1]OZF49176.1 esterase family protein [Rhodococcus sp. 14-2470-1a]